MTDEEKAYFVSQCKYFWNEKGEMERYVDFSIEKLREADPALAFVYEQYKNAETALTRLLEY
jgi:hypothetical protein